MGFIMEFIIFIILKANEFGGNLANLDLYIRLKIMGYIKKPENIKTI